MARHGSVMFGWNWTEVSILASQVFAPLLPLLQAIPGFEEEENRSC